MKYILIIIVIFFSGISRADIESSYSASYYEFDARDIKSLVAAIKTTGPKVNDKTVWASIHWELNTEYSFKSNDNGCHIVIKNMDLVASVQLPQWRNIANQSVKLRDWWAEYSRFISQHENLHFDNALSSAKDFEIKLLKMPKQLNCIEAKSKYLVLKHDFLYDVGKLDQQIDLKSKRLFNKNDKLFSPLKGFSSVAFESGGMRSYISL